MNRKPIYIVLASTVCAVWLSSCATGPKPLLRRQTGESLVCIGEEPAALAWIPVRGKSLRMRNSYWVSAATVEYAQGRDFVVDYAQGTLRRTPQSLMPDFRTNVLFGQEAFDHSKFPGYGNGGFFAFVDYYFRNPSPWPPQIRPSDIPKRTQAKLIRGEPVKIVAFGDSITAGGDASRPDLIFWNRWVDELRHKYPSASITALNGATPGDTTAQGLARLKTKVIDVHPDLVLIGFGMNDHNVSEYGVPLAQFERNLEQMIGRIRQETMAEIILYSAFPPNPKWKYGSHHMADYAAATERVAREQSCAYADVFNSWQALAARKKPEDLLGNNINHPNDFGHWIYYRALGEIGL